MQPLSWSLSLTMQSLSLFLLLKSLSLSLSWSLNKSPWSCPCDCVQFYLKVNLLKRHVHGAVVVDSLYCVKQLSTSM